MNEADVIAALDMPQSSRVDQRVPKKLLVENGAPTAADKRKINEGIEEVFWLAALKPTTIGVPEFRDGTREYLEIAVLRAVLRATAQAARLAELIHRAVPYPVLLIATQGDALTISLAHKRRSQGEAGATVLDGALVVADPAAVRTAGVVAAFVSEMAVARQPRTDLFTLYQGWIDTVEALLAAQVTGTFAVVAAKAGVPLGNVYDDFKTKRTCSAPSSASAPRFRGAPPSSACAPWWTRSVHVPTTSCASAARTARSPATSRSATA